MTKPSSGTLFALVCAAAAGLGARAGIAPAPPLSPAQGATLASCADLERTLALPLTSFSATLVPAGELGVAGKPIGSHCRSPAA